MGKIGKPRWGNCDEERLGEDLGIPVRLWILCCRPSEATEDEILRITWLVFQDYNDARDLLFALQGPFSLFSTYFSAPRSHYVWTTSTGFLDFSLPCGFDQ